MLRVGALLKRPWSEKSPNEQQLIQATLRLLKDAAGDGVRLVDCRGDQSVILRETSWFGQIIPHGRPAVFGFKTGIEAQDLLSIQLEFLHVKHAAVMIEIDPGPPIDQGFRLLA